LSTGASGAARISLKEVNVVLFGAHRRKPAIEDGDGLATFMDAEADAFAAAVVDDYARARARVDADRLFAQPRFAAVLATARAEAFPFALTLVAETVESTLAPQTGDRGARIRALVALAQTVFAQRAVPHTVSAPAWSAAGEEVVRWLAESARRPSRTTDAIAERLASSMLALMPVHDDLAPDDYLLFRTSMREALAAVRERFIANTNALSLADALTHWL